MSDDAEKPDADDEGGPFPTPEERQFAKPSPNWPTIRSCGGEWALPLAGLAEIVRAERDRLFDMSTMRGMVDVKDLRVVVYYALTTAYRLTDAEVKEIIWRANREEMIEAAYEVVFGEVVLRTYSAWAESGLVSCGIDPAKVRPELLPLVLRHLEKTGRIEPAETFTQAGEAQGKRKALFDAVKS